MLLSVVTPVYNGARFLREAYSCLCRQTYSDWEWVVVDDGSTDDTLAILQQLAADDRRIKYRHQANSGSAKQPRDRAVFESEGDYIVPLDVDDLLADDYLATMLERSKETDADIVYPHMVFVDMRDGRTIAELPTQEIDTSRIYNGRELVKETMPEWNIGCNGGLYRRQIWSDLSYPEKRQTVWMNSDEVDERYYLLRARRVAFAHADYTYRNHGESITNKLSPKLFHILVTNGQLMELMAKEFGRESEEYRRANLRNFYGWRSLMAVYAKRHDELTASDVVEQHLREAFCRIDAQLLSRTERLKFLGFKNFQIAMGLFSLKYSPRLLCKKIMQHFMPTAYRWWIIRRRNEREVKQQLAPLYSGKPSDKKAEDPSVACIFSGQVSQGGLADRLRGIVSTFMMAREQHRPFRLFFNHPFRLADYLQPNAYDWRCQREELRFDSSTVRVVSDSQTCTRRERQYQERLIARSIARNKDVQVHVYTNADFCYEKDYQEAFCQLFKPSDMLEKHLGVIANEIGGTYITVSARFCNLLDDFNEEVYSEPLEPERQQQMIDACIALVGQLHDDHPGQRIVVCTDSRKFIDKARQLDYVYCIEGTVSHIDNDQAHDYGYYEKTFLDFFTIVRADATYLLRGPEMLSSGFPYAASLIGGKQLKVIEFQI